MGIGYTLWFTGLSGAGKSRIAAIVERRLRERGDGLDADDVRECLSKGLGFSKENRETSLRRIAVVANLLSRNGVHVRAIAPYRESRAEARMLHGDRFIEVYIKASLEECARRDLKGLYGKALAGEVAEFTGVSAPYEEPTVAELVIDSEHQTPEESADEVVAYLEERTPRALVEA